MVEEKRPRQKTTKETDEGKNNREQNICHHFAVLSHDRAHQTHSISVNLLSSQTERDCLPSGVHEFYCV